MQGVFSDSLTTCKGNRGGLNSGWIVRYNAYAGAYVANEGARK